MRMMTSQSPALRNEGSSVPPRTAANPTRRHDTDDIEYPGKRAHSLLLALALLQYLTIEQARRLLYGKSYGKTATAFRTLEALGLVKFVWLPPPNNRLGGASKVYTLTKKGIAYLAAIGETGLENKIKNPLNLQHPLRISDFLITAQLFCKHDTRFTIDEMFHERVLNDRLRTNVANQVTIHVKTRDSSIEEKIVSPILDALLIISSQGTTYPIGVEIDMGTESEEQWRSKVAALVQWVRGPYRSLFSYKAITIATVTTSQNRLQQLCAWTRDELQTTGRGKYLEIFVFTDVAPESDPQTLFLTPVWRLAAEETRFPLLQAESD
jgi:hypothetical protein